MTPALPTGHRLTAAITAVFMASLAAAHTAPAQQDAPQQQPAPIVRVPHRAPAQTAPGTNGTNGTTGTAGPVVHRPRPVPNLSPTYTTPGLEPETAPLLPARRPPPASTVTRPTAQTGSAATTPVAPKPHTSAATTATTTAAKAATPAATATAPKAAISAPSAPAHKPNTINGLNRDVIVLDPGHGGTDSGARIGDATLEKNVTLALAFRLRSLLLARGFTVVLTRDSDAATIQTSPNAAPAPLTLDDRAGIANHARAAACLLLHATGRGTGLHVYSSDLEPIPAEPAYAPWLTAQAAWVPASKALEGQLSAALGRSHVTLLSSTASIRPVDSLTCPALVLELAPNDDTPASINDAGYQEHVAAAVAGALVVWENAVQPPPHLAPPPRVHHIPADATAPATAAPEAQP